MAEQNIKKIYRFSIIFIIILSMIIPIVYLILFSTSETIEGETLKNSLQRAAILTVTIGVIIILSFFLFNFIASFILKLKKNKENSLVE